jgi:hypothetical protein
MDKKSTGVSAPKMMSLFLAVIFAAVGLLFLLIPGGVLRFFNSISRPMGMARAPEVGYQFYLILAVAYMYAVTLLAWLMFRQPQNKAYPLLLSQAKLASSLLSFCLFFLHQPYLIYLANGIIDGAIGLAVLFVYLKMRQNPNLEHPR